MFIFIICHVWEAPNSTLTALPHHIIPLSSSQGIMYCVVLYILHSILHLLLMNLLALHYNNCTPQVLYGLTLYVSHVVFMFCKSTSNCGTKFIRGCFYKKKTQSFTCNFQILLLHTHTHTHTHTHIFATFEKHDDDGDDDATWRH
jgi:hypothetical protein